MSNIGNRVKALRKHKGITQTQLGEAIGLSFSAISAIEKGHSESPETLDAIAKYFEVTPLWVRTGEGIAPKGVIVITANKATDSSNSEVEFLKMENHRLWQLINHLTGGKILEANFLKPTHNTLMLDFPNMHEVGKTAPMRVG